jgi:hypothetical protein
MSKIISISSINVGKVVGFNTYQLANGHLIKWDSGSGKGTLTNQAFVLALSPNLKFTDNVGSKYYGHYVDMLKTNTNNKDSDAKKEINEELSRVFQLREHGEIPIYKSCMIVEYENNRSSNTYLSITYLDKTITNPMKNPTDLVKRTYIELSKNNIESFYEQLSILLEYDSGDNMNVYEAIQYISEKIDFVSIINQASKDIKSNTESSSLYTEAKNTNNFFIASRGEIDTYIQMSIQANKSKLPSKLLSNDIENLKISKFLDKNVIDNTIDVFRKAQLALEKNPKALKEQYEILEKALYNFDFDNIKNIEKEILFIIKSIEEQNEKKESERYAESEKNKRELKEFSDLLKKNTSDINRVEKKYNIQHDNLIKFKTSIERLESKIPKLDTYSTSYSDIENSEDTLDEEKNQTSSQLKRIQDSIDNKESMKIKTIFDIKQLKEDIKKSNEHLIRLKDNILAYKEKIDKNKLFISDRPKQLLILSNQISVLLEKIKEYEEQLKIKRDESNKLYKERESIERNINDFEAQKTQKYNKINSLKDTISVKKSELLNLADKRKSLLDLLEEKETYSNTTNPNLLEIRHFVEEVIPIIKDREVTGVMTTFLKTFIVSFKQFLEKEYNKVFSSYNVNNYKKKLSKEELTKSLEQNEDFTKIATLKIEETELQLIELDKLLTEFEHADFKRLEQDKLEKISKTEFILNTEIERITALKIKIQEKFEDTKKEKEKLELKTDDELLSELKIIEDTLEKEIETKQYNIKIVEDANKKINILNLELKNMEEDTQEEQHEKLIILRGNLEVIKKKLEMIHDYQTIFRENIKIFNVDKEEAVDLNSQEILEIFEDKEFILKEELEDARNKQNILDKKVEKLNELKNNLEKGEQTYNYNEEKLQQIKTSVFYENILDFYDEYFVSNKSELGILELFDIYKVYEEEYNKNNKSLQFIYNEFKENNYNDILSSITEDNTLYTNFTDLVEIKNDIEGELQTEDDEKKNVIDKLSITFQELIDIQKNIFNNFGSLLIKQQMMVKNNAKTTAGNHLELYIENLNNIKKGIFKFTSETGKIENDGFFEQISAFFNVISGNDISKNIYIDLNGAEITNYTEDIERNWDEIQKESFEDIIKLFLGFSISKYKAKILSILLKNTTLVTINTNGEDIGDSTGQNLTLVTKLSLSILSAIEEKELENFPFIVDESSGALEEDVLNVKEMLLEHNFSPIFTQNEAKFSNEFNNNLHIHNLKIIKPQLFLSYSSINRENIKEKIIEVKIPLEESEEIEVTEEVEVKEVGNELIF